MPICGQWGICVTPFVRIPSCPAVILVGVEVALAGRDYPGTLRAFNAWFPDDEACLRYLLGCVGGAGSSAPSAAAGRRGG